MLTRVELAELSIAPRPSLMLASDVLVTDYSSSVFEYALLRRPLILLSADLDEYEREGGACNPGESGRPSLRQ